MTTLYIKRKFDLTVRKAKGMRSRGKHRVFLPGFELNDATGKSHSIVRRRIQSNLASPRGCHHLINLFALDSNSGGMVRPICLAVFRLITSSNFVGCSTGRSAGLAPFRILST